MPKIELIPFQDNEVNYHLLYKWCNEAFVYEWFEQRKLSYEEIIKKYQTKLLTNKQKLYLILYNQKPIGFTQIYKYDDLIYDELKKFKNIYEYDIFIGEEAYLSKGIGSQIIDIINAYIYQNYQADCLILRPFKRNIRAIKCYQKCQFKIIRTYLDKDTLGNDEEIVVLINSKE